MNSTIPMLLLKAPNSKQRINLQFQPPLRQPCKLITTLSLHRTLNFHQSDAPQPFRPPHPNLIFCLLHNHGDIVHSAPARRIERENSDLNGYYSPKKAPLTPTRNTGACHTRRGEKCCCYVSFQDARAAHTTHKK